MRRIVLSLRVRRCAIAAIAIAAMVAVSIRIGFARRTADPRALECASATHEEHVIKERIRIHPGCPKAHFAYAQLLAKQNRNDEARRELREAERLQPGLAFAPANDVSDLSRKLGVSDEVAHSQQFHY